MSPGRQSRSRCLVMVADGGATHTRVCVADLEGQIYGHGKAGPCNAFAVGFRRTQENLRLALQGALRVSGVAVSDIRAVVAGLASVGVSGEDSVPYGQQLHRLLPQARVQILGDMLIAHEGALAGKPGVVIVSGTGSVVFGRDEEGKVVRVGGWGAWFGDEGSAQWIGREGLQRAAHAVDGTGQPTALVGALEHHFRVQDFAHIVPLIYRDPSPAALGELAPVVTACARRGDGVAQQILCEAAEWLALQASTAMKSLDLKRPEASYEGSLLRGEACLRRAVKQSLRRLAPGVKFVAPCLPPIGGAWLMAAKLLGVHPTEAAIQTFRRQCHD